MPGLNISRKEIERQVVDLISDIADIDRKKITLKSKIVDDLAVDSFMAVEIFYNAGEKFGINIPNEKLLKVKTIKDIVNLVEKTI